MRYTKPTPCGIKFLPSENLGKGPEEPRSNHDFEEVVTSAILVGGVSGDTWGWSPKAIDTRGWSPEAMMLGGGVPKLLILGGGVTKMLILGGGVLKQESR